MCHFIDVGPRPVGAEYALNSVVPAVALLMRGMGIGAIGYASFEKQHVPMAIIVQRIGVPVLTTSCAVCLSWAALVRLFQGRADTFEPCLVHVVWIDFFACRVAVHDENIVSSF